LNSPILPPEYRELYEERAAFMEMDAGLTRAEAEELALADIRRVIEEREVARRKAAGRL
jgi:hypothetical protein